MFKVAEKVVFGINFVLNYSNLSGGLTMKAMNLTTGLVLVLLVSACSTSRLAGPGLYYDDVYYVPGATRDNINQAFSPVPAISKDAKKAESRDFEMQQRDYQKTRNSGEQDSRDFAALQEQYAALLSDNSKQEVDTLIYYNDETGYWVGGFDGSTMDRDYAERMIRFHGPFIRIPYYSPVYSEIVYFNHYDWNVYVDGNYAYAFPTWTNRWYNSFYYNSWGYPRWSIGMSWGYPYYNYWGFGYGWYDPFYYSFYSPYYYWHYPYYRHPYYYGGGYYSGHNPKTSNRTYYSGMRTGLSSNTRPLASTSFNSREILKRTSGERVEVTNSGTRISRDQQGNTRYETEGGTVYTRTSRGGASQDGLKSGTAATETPTRTGTVQQGNTRRSYTPSYSKPEDNSRPTYNRTSYTRVSGDSRNPQTTGTVQSTNTGTRQVQSGTTTPSTRNTTLAPGSGSTRSTVSPSNTRSSSTTTYQQGSSTSAPRTSTVTSPTRSSSSAPSRSYDSGSSSSRSSVSSGSSSSSSSSGAGSSGSSSSSSGGGTVRQGRR